MSKSIKVKSKKTVEKTSMNDLYKFSKAGDSIQGKVTGIREGTTKYGECRFVEITDFDGVCLTVAMASGLLGYDWDNLIGKYVEIEAKGYEKNERTSRVYMSFDVSELELE